MGQQQLLLVILVTIIVGIATVVAINTFGSAADQANIDAVTNDIATLASSAQGYFMRPEMLGGGSRDFTGLTFDGLAFPANGVNSTELIAENENGRYIINVVDASTFEITAHPASSPTYTSGTVTAAGVLTPGSAAESEDQIVATVGPSSFSINS